MSQNEEGHIIFSVGDKSDMEHGTTVDPGNDIRPDPESDPERDRKNPEKWVRITYVMLYCTL